MKEYRFPAYTSMDDLLEAGRRRDLKAHIENCEEIKFRFMCVLADTKEASESLYEMYESKVESMQFVIDLMLKELSK